MVPAGDAAALAAYVRLLGVVASSGSAGQRAARLAAWEQSAQVAPLWELLFQLMCCPVPQVRFPMRPVCMHWVVWRLVRAHLCMASRHFRNLLWSGVQAWPGMGGPCPEH